MDPLAGRDCLWLVRRRFPFISCHCQAGLRHPDAAWEKELEALRFMRPLNYLVCTPHYCAGDIYCIAVSSPRSREGGLILLSESSNAPHGWINIVHNRGNFLAGN